MNSIAPSCSAQLLAFPFMAQLVLCPKPVVPIMSMLAAALPVQLDARPRMTSSLTVWPWVRGFIGLGLSSVIDDRPRSLLRRRWFAIFSLPPPPRFVDTATPRTHWSVLITSIHPDITDS
jgi:hypothetical protein